MTDKPNWGGQEIPFMQEAEEAVIGSVLVNPAAFFSVASFLKAEDFFLLRNKYIWQAIDRLSERGETIDYLTVTAELKAIDKYSDIGGGGYLTQVINATPTSIHAEVYGRLVQRAAIRRRLLGVADEIKSLALNQEIAVEQIESQIDQKLLSVHTTSMAAFKSLRETVSEHFERTETAMENPSEMLGIPTCFNDLNKYLRGWRKKKLYVLAGRPGMGKSSLLLTEAVNMARMGLPVAFFTMEMGQEEITENIIAAEMKVNADVISTGSMTPAQWTQYVEVSGRVSKWPLYIDDTSGITPSQLRIRTRQLAHEVGLKAVFVDYIQLMSGGGEIKYSNRDQEIGYISRSLKSLSKELNVPVIAAAQLSREVERREDKRPQLSDLRESGNIENDADVVMFLYRDDYYTKPYPAPMVSDVEVAIAKHRGGRTGRTNIGFWGEIKKFVELEKRTISTNGVHA